MVARFAWAFALVAIRAAGAGVRNNGQLVMMWTMPTHQTVRLSAGRHRSPHAGACVMELASMLADEPFSDRPDTASPVVAAFLRTYNDGLDDERRASLYPLAALVVGSAGGRALEEERASRCIGFARGLGSHLPSGRASLGMATAEASGTLAAIAALRTGPTPEVHARALSFARELAELRPLRRHGSWPTWLIGRDPAQAVAETLSMGSSSESATPVSAPVAAGASPGSRRTPA